MKKTLLSLLLIAGTFFPFAAFASGGRNFCSSGEKWVFTGEIRADFVLDFETFLSGNSSEVSGFSNALALRRIAQSAEAKLFADYWISRALFQARLYHIAHAGFSQIAARAPAQSSLGLQMAALECLLRIEQRYPAMKLPETVSRLLPEYLALAKSLAKPLAKEAKPSPVQLPVVWEAAHALLRLQLAENSSKSKLQQTLSLLAGSGPYDSLGKALLAAKQNEHGMTVKEIRGFFESGPTPPALTRYLDEAHILLARAHYALGQFDRAVDQYKLVAKTSNHLASSLSELAWAYLLSERYSEAIGTAMNLQAGGLRHTFEPESPMVMAMALNELCQYPESVRTIHVFRRNYDPTYRWLNAWNTAGNEPLYPLALDYLKKKGKTPDRVSSEWVKSPLFISNQDEINLLFDEQDSAGRLGKSGAQEQYKTAESLISMIEGLSPRFKSAKLKQKPGQRLPKDLIKDLKLLKAKLVHYRRLQHAAPIWRAILANHQKQVPALKARLIAEINLDLKSRTIRMRDQLDEIAENLQLVEVEIFNGASHDIIWQNAHPDYKAVAKKLQDDRNHAEGEKVWDWGKTTVSAEDSTEIWEDELGSFQANLVDNCSSKDRYLALKLKERSR